jgi:hypothetical protein
MPPRPRRCPFHEPDRRDEHIEHARIMARLCRRAERAVQLVRLLTDEVAGFVNPDPAQVPGNRRPDVRNVFKHRDPDCSHHALPLSLNGPF